MRQRGHHEDDSKFLGEEAHARPRLIRNAKTTRKRVQRGGRGKGEASMCRSKKKQFWLRFFSEEATGLKGAI